MFKPLSSYGFVLSVALGLAAVGLSSGSVVGDEISYNFDGTTYGTNYLEGDFFPLPTFDESLGPLQAVTLTVSPAAFTEPYLHVSDSDPVNGGSVIVTGASSWTCWAGNMTLSGGGTATTTGVVVPGDNLIWGWDANLGPSQSASSAGGGMWLSGGLNFMVGELGCDFSFVTDPPGLPVSALWSGIMSVAWQGTLTYTYAPEPSTVVLLGIGVVTLTAYGWRKRRRTA